MPGGSSQSTQDTVVQYTNPYSALQAGTIGASAAYAASQQADKSINDAINSVNSSYDKASALLSPTSVVGVQALDQLNQYLGLNPFKPNAPTAPIAPTLTTEMENLTQGDINSYIQGNLGVHDNGGNGAGGSNPGSNTWLTYNGVGVDESNGEDPQFRSANSISNATLESWNGVTGAHPSAQLGGNILAAPDGAAAALEASGRYSGTGTLNMGDAVATQLAEQALPGDLRTYNQTTLPGYNTQLSTYNQEEALNQQYTAEGPLSSQQIQDKISNQPGYQAQLQEGQQVINNNAGAKGLVGSGAMLKQLMSFGQSTLSQFYGNTLNQLAGVAGAGQQATNTLAGDSISQGNSIASLLTQIGSNDANATLAAGNSLSQATIAANPVFQTIQTGQSSSNSGADLGGIGSLIGALGAL